MENVRVGPAALGGGACAQKASLHQRSARREPGVMAIRASGGRALPSAGSECTMEQGDS